ncbi:efflux RND transporter periplasmic adaptor subunit [Acetobacter okinawensis]|uniref:efflux RND transporter periplasmic adaptor subunit n=1 Tax=Acetobacter okinawensis TaxID=1076594 RepID=UPI00214D2F35|nr:efflux RND transporter periplasmic adaptor subunit [Acetobacter okinawensis]
MALYSFTPILAASLLSGFILSTAQAAQTGHDLPVSQIQAAPTPVPSLTPAQDPGVAQPLAQALPAPMQALAPTAPGTPEDRPAVQITAPTNTQISAGMAGQLVAFPLQDGDRFKAGDVLARFQCSQQEATLAHARAEYVKHRGLLDVQTRMKALGQWSVSDLHTAEADLQAANADLKMALAVVAQCTIEAPFSGRVSNLMVHDYQYLSPGTPMLEILDDSALELSMLVSSTALRHLQPGATFQVWIHETDRTYAARVTRISGKVDPVSKTVKIYAQLVQPVSDLLPGMTGSAILKD